jgi:hypothetical protein
MDLGGDGECEERGRRDRAGIIAKLARALKVEAAEPAEDIWPGEHVALRGSRKRPHA